MVFKWLHNNQTKKSFPTTWKKLGRVWGSSPQALTWSFLKSFIPSTQENALTLWKKLDRVWGSTTSRSFNRCWQSAQYHDENILQRREMSWAVTGDVGERGPAINLKLLKLLHNIWTKKVFQHREKTGPCLGEHGPAITLNVFKKLQTI